MALSIDGPSLATENTVATLTGTDFTVGTPVDQPEEGELANTGFLLFLLIPWCREPQCFDRQQ